MSVQGHAPRRRFGQNFLVDRDVIEGIVRAVDPRPGERIVEIGPGLGALTDLLLARAGRLDVIEIDRDLAARLRIAHPDAALTVHEADALRFDWSAIAGPLRLVGNLPYNVSTPLLFRIADLATRLRDAHFMLQREVVDRMVAAPGSAEYGRLSVMLQYRFRMEKVLDVAPESFRPAPKVRSAVVRLVPHPVAGDVDVAVLAGVVTAAFTKRRKMLRNALEGVLPDGAIAEAGLDPACRPETVSLEQFVALARLARQPAGE